MESPLNLPAAREVRQDLHPGAPHVNGYAFQNLSLPTITFEWEVLRVLSLFLNTLHVLSLFAISLFPACGYSKTGGNNQCSRFGERN
jgi:hypothetical protein